MVSPEARCSERIEPGDGRRFVRHRMAPRETVSQVAHRYDVDAWQLREWNGLGPDVQDLRTGKRLRIKANRIPPPRTKIEYAVQDGDTWWRVAVAHGVDSMDLRAYNWPHRGKMSPGKTLKIWVDPVVHAWIQSEAQTLFDAEPGSVRLGAIGSGPPNGGRLINGIRIPDADGYRLRFPQSAYGTTHAVTQFLDAMARFAHSRPDAEPLPIGAMSRQRGGPIGSHQSHQTGRDLDVSLPRRQGIPGWYVLKPSRVDWPAVWDLVRAFGETDVEVIFLDYRVQRRLHKAAVAAGATDQEREALLQYPRGRFARLGLVRHADGHDKHMHVRFACGPCEVECVDNTVRGEDDPP
jgi:LysM repeat protein